MNSQVTVMRKKGIWILSSVYIQSLWRQTLHPLWNSRNMCLPLQAPHIKKLLSPVLQDILRPYESHSPVTSFFIYRVQQNKQKYVVSSSLTKDTGEPYTMGTKKTSFHLWVTICTELRGKCSICKDAIRQLRWSSLLFTYQSELRSSSGAGNSFFLFVATSCSKSLPWNGSCQHV